MLIFHFWAIFGGKMGVAIRHALNGQGPQKPTKKLAHWMYLLSKLLYINHGF